MKVRLNKYKIKGQIEKILWITLFWTLFAIFQFSMGYITLIEPTFKVDPSTFNAGDYLKGTIFMGIIAGLLGGILLVFFWENWLRPNPIVGHC